MYLWCDVFVTRQPGIFNEWKHLLEVDPHKHDVNAGKALQTRKEEAAQGRDWQDPCGEKEGEDRQQLTGSGWETNSFDLLEYLLHLVLDCSWIHKAPASAPKNQLVLTGFDRKSEQS